MLGTVAPPTVLGIWVPQMVLGTLVASKLLGILVSTAVLGPRAAFLVLETPLSTMVFGAWNRGLTVVAEASDQLVRCSAVC